MYIHCSLWKFLIERMNDFWATNIIRLYSLPEGQARKLVSFAPCRLYLTNVKRKYFNKILSVLLLHVQDTAWQAPQAIITAQTQRSLPQLWHWVCGSFSCTRWLRQNIRQLISALRSDRFLDCHWRVSCFSIGLHLQQKGFCV